jgi:hypothetical protein
MKVTFNNITVTTRPGIRVFASVWGETENDWPIEEVKDGAVPKNTFRIEFWEGGMEGTRVGVIHPDAGGSYIKM